jgi:large subunit ribosomal protein L2
MPLQKVKPTSPGRRSLVKVVHPNLHKGRPIDALTESKKRGSGRNNNGHITMRHKGGGHKHHYRIVDYKRDKDGIPAKVSGSSTTRIAVRTWHSAVRRRRAPLHRGSARRHRRHAAHVRRGSGDQAGQLPAGAEHPGRHDGALHRAFAGQGRAARPLRGLCGANSWPAKASTRRSACAPGEIRKVHVDCRAVIGEVGNEEHNLRSIGKAGANRWRGIRPTVRGISMNPVDHPMGGRGNGGGGRHHPMSPWGTPAKGYKTRRNKRTDSMIVRRRHASKG